MLRRLALVALFARAAPQPQCFFNVTRHAGSASGAAGAADGAAGTFSQPTGVAVLDNGLLAVLDAGVRACARALVMMCLVVVACAEDAN